MATNYPTARAAVPAAPAPSLPRPRVVVLKADCLYGDLICRQVRHCWPGAEVAAFQKGLDALDAIQANQPELFITGVHLDDMDGVEHLEPFLRGTPAILVVTTRHDARTFAMLREVRYDGLFDARLDREPDLRIALAEVLAGRRYISESFLPHLVAPRRITRDALTRREEVILSAIGDGADNQQAADLLRLSAFTVSTHRKAIMAKLRLHHKGELIRYAVQNGYVIMKPGRVAHPGFHRALFRSWADPEAPKAKAA